MKKIALLIATLTLSSTILTGCVKPYDRPEFQKIEASQTGFLISLVGDSTEQSAFQSEELLKQTMVATKEVQIPHRWVQTGRWEWRGEWRPTATLIVVERKPVSRSWESGDTAADSANKAIFAETSDDIGIYVGMNCTAMIEEADAAKFLYRYNNTPLDTIIDTDIKKMVEDEFNMVVGKIASANLTASKESIMNTVKTNVVEHFKEYGITIVVLGLKEGFSYENPAIQEALDAKYASEQELVIQQNKNEAAIAKAEAEAKAVIIAAKAEAEANELLSQSITDEILELEKYEKWDGKLPTYVGGDGEGMMIGIN